jgi:thioredoxin 1
MPTTSPIPKLDDAHFDAEVLESDLPVVVDFTAAWCAPCRVMDPVIAELAAERDDVRFVKVDVDQNQATAARYGVMSMPTFMVFRQGTPAATLVGSRPKRKLVREIDAAI